MKVLLVDDHPLFLDGLKNLLTSRGVQVVGCARDGLEALDKARTLHPDVILMDIHMPQLDGLAALRLIKAELPEIRIVMLTMSARMKTCLRPSRAARAVICSRRRTPTSSSRCCRTWRAARWRFRRDWLPGFFLSLDGRPARRWQLKTKSSAGACLRAR